MPWSIGEGKAPSFLKKFPCIQPRYVKQTVCSLFERLGRRGLYVVFPKIALKLGKLLEPFLGKKTLDYFRRYLTRC